MTVEFADKKVVSAESGPHGDVRSLAIKSSGGGGEFFSENPPLDSQIEDRQTGDDDMADHRSTDHHTTVSEDPSTKVSDASTTSTTSDGSDIPETDPSTEYDQKNHSVRNLGLREDISFESSGAKFMEVDSPEFVIAGNSDGEMRSGEGSAGFREALNETAKGAAGTIESSASEAQSLDDLVIDLSEIARIIPNKMAFKIGEVAEITGLKTYVLRYWESEFEALNPQKSAFNQRMYSRRDVETVLLIKKLLYEEKFSIAGAKRKLKELRRELKSEKQLMEVNEKLDFAADKVAELIEEIGVLKRLFA